MAEESPKKLEQYLNKIDEEYPEWRVRPDQAAQLDAWIYPYLQNAAPYTGAGYPVA